MSVLVVAVMLAVTLGFVALRASKTGKPPSVSPSTGATIPPSGSRSTPFTVNSTSILSNGIPFLSYGVTIFGIAGPTWQAGQLLDLQRIAAIAGYWGGNTVRIQVAPPLLASQGATYLAVLRHEVETARTDGLNVIISAQYERTRKILGPDDSTVAFWRTVAPEFASDPHVWFDLFNEPVETSDPKSPDLPTSASWQTWRNGGSGFVGMQTLVDDVRALAPDNLILAEGLKGGKTLGNIGGNELAGSNIVYSVHPYFSLFNRLPSEWDANFGDLATQIPILIGEWGEYQTTRNSCVENAPALVPAFMHYVTAHHVGLIAWALESGNMIRGSNLNDPTAFDPGIPYQCVRTSPGADAQGAGASIRALFAAST